MMRNFLLLISFTLFVSHANCQTINMFAPPGFPEATLQQYRDDFKGYYLLGMTVNDPLEPRIICILNSRAEVVWFKEQFQPFIDTDFNFDPKASQYYFASVAQGAGGAKRIRVDSLFEVIDTTNTINGVKHDLHDFKVLDNGHKLILGSLDTLMDMSAYTFGTKPGRTETTVKYTVIQELDSKDSLIFQWNGIKHIHPTEFIGETYNYRRNNFDYTHINAIDVDDDGNWLVSMRHTDAIYKIDRINKTGSILWRLGGKLSDFTLLGDTVPFSGQHHIRAYGNQIYSLYDNGNSKEIKVSRGMVYQLDTTNNTAHAQWSYKHPMDVYGSATGNHQVIQDSLHLISWGQVFRPFPTFTLVDQNKEIWVDFSLEDGYMTYRTFAYEQLPLLNQPEIRCDSVEGGWMLSAPSGHEAYLWSNGANSQSIFVDNQQTDYMVWVKDGIGYFASERFSVNRGECQLNTGLSAINTHQPDDPVIGMYDIQGRSIRVPANGQLYLLHHQSGKVSKKMWTQP